MTAQQIVFLNGEFVALEDAKIPVLDRGFIFGDGIYEVVPAYNRQPFRWPHHRARLQRSLAKLRIDPGMDNDALDDLVRALIERHPWANQFVYIQITRGVAKRDHAFPAADTKPTIFAMSSPFTPPSETTLSTGVHVITHPDERWLNCDIKSISLLGNVLARQAAADEGAIEALLFRDGLLTEGSNSNVWIARGGQLLSPHKDRRVLEGIRMGLMEELCETTGITLDQRNITRDEVLKADEIMLTSATKEILPVVQLDGVPVGNGRPGPLFKRLWQAYQDAKQAQLGVAQVR